MFDLRTEERLQAWRDFRNSIEVSDTPLQDVDQFWAKAPYSSKVIDPYYVASWPDPWKLVINNHYDLLAITLGMCYTLTLTARFNGVKCELYTSVDSKEDPRYMCVVDNKHVLNLHHGTVATNNEMPPNAILLWDSSNNQK